MTEVVKVKRVQEPFSCSAFPIQQYRWHCCGCDTTVTEIKQYGQLTVCPKCRHLPCAGCGMLKNKKRGRPRKA